MRKLHTFPSSHLHDLHRKIRLIAFQLLIRLHPTCIAFHNSHNNRARKHRLLSHILGMKAMIVADKKTKKGERDASNMKHALGSVRALRQLKCLVMHLTWKVLFPSLLCVVSCGVVLCGGSRLSRLKMQIKVVTQRLAKEKLSPAAGVAEKTCNSSSSIFCVEFVGGKRSEKKTTWKEFPWRLKLVQGSPELNPSSNSMFHLLIASGWLIKRRCFVARKIGFVSGTFRLWGVWGKFHGLESYAD